MIEINHTSNCKLHTDGDWVWIYVIPVRNISFYGEVSSDRSRDIELQLQKFALRSMPLDRREVVICGCIS